jgi:integrase
VVDRLPAALAAAPSRLARLTDTWLRVRRSERTRAAFRRDLQGWLVHCAQAGVDPLRTRAADVDGWIVAQRLHGARSAGTRPAAEATIARRIAAVSSWYDFLIAGTADDSHPLVTRNPAGRAARPRLDPDHSATVGLTDVEMDRLLAAADADSATSSALIRLELTDGLRVGSTLTARVEHLGWDSGHRTLDITVKGGKTKRIPLPPVVADAVAEMLAERGNPTEGPLFLTPAGTAIYHMYVYRVVRRLARAAGLPAADRLTSHALRHAVITLYLERTNGNVRGAQQFAGHARPETTMRYDRARRTLSEHGSYDLAGRFGTRTRPGTGARAARWRPGGRPAGTHRRRPTRTGRTLTPGRWCSSSWPARPGPPPRPPPRRAAVGRCSSRLQSCSPAGSPTSSPPDDAPAPSPGCAVPSATSTSWSSSPARSPPGGRS